jgi:hypothetical protein
MTHTKAQQTFLVFARALKTYRLSDGWKFSRLLYKMIVNNMLRLPRELKPANILQHDEIFLIICIYHTNNHKQL